jgi:hypothetical protein
MPTVGSILESSILAIGLQICFYMSLAGFACAWYYRDMLKTSRRESLTHVVWPFIGAAFMVFIGLYSIPTFENVTLIIGVGGLLLGFIPLMLGRMRKGKPA